MSRLVSDKSENRFIFHHSIHASPARNQKQVELWGFIQSFLWHEHQSFCIPDWFRCLGENVKRGIGDPREHFKRAGEIGLIKLREEDAPDLQMDFIWNDAH